MANNLSAFDAQAWSKRLITKLDFINIMLGLVNRDWEGELQNIGDTVQVRTPGSITMGSYTKGGTINYQDLAPVKEAFTVSDAAYFAFLVDDLDKAQTDINALDVYIKRAAVAVNNKVEAKLLSQTQNANTIITGTSNAAITLSSANIYQYFVQARTVLGQANVPLQDRYAIVDPATTGLLLQDTTHFIRSTDLGDAVVSNGSLNGEVNVRPGFIGRCAGFDVYESNQVYNDGTNKYLLFADPDFISYAAQLKEMEILRLQTTFADAVRGLLLHDAHVFAECAKRGVALKATP